MREIHADRITETVARLCIDACYHIGDDVKALIEKARNRGIPHGRKILEQLIENINISAAHGLPVCQDTGMAVVFLEIGQDVHITGGISPRP